MSANRFLQSEPSLIPLGAEPPVEFTHAAMMSARVFNSATGSFSPTTYTLTALTVAVVGATIIVGKFAVVVWPATIVNVKVPSEPPDGPVTSAV